VQEKRGRECRIWN